MLQVTNFAMKKTTLIILTMFIFILSGCGEAPRAQQGNFFTDSNQNNNNNNVVINDPATPLSCDRENDQYYDFLDTKDCIRPITYEQLYILERFHTVNEMAEKDPNEIIKIQVGFKHYPTKEEFEALIDESVERLLMVDLFYPDFAGGTSMPEFIRDEAITKEQAFQYILDKNRVGAIQWFDHSFKDFFGEFNDSMITNYQNKGARFTMKRGAIADWWQQHTSLIRVVQPILGDIDNTQHMFTPEEKIGPEEQTINWEEN